MTRKCYNHRLTHATMTDKDTHTHDNELIEENRVRNHWAGAFFI